MKSWVPYTILIVLVLLSVVPFAGRAVYIDEHMFLQIAKSAAEKDWQFPQDTEWVFFGTRVANLSLQTHPPVGEYYLAFLFKLLGHFNEARFRLLFIVFPLLAALSFYRLAQRFIATPLLAASLFAVSPAFFVLNPTLMMDVPMLAFLLLGISLYLDSLDGKRARLWPASMCFILAAGTGYTALIPLGCVFVWAVATRRPKLEWLAIAAAPVVLGLWLVMMRVHFGEYPALKVAQYFLVHSSFLTNLLPIFSFLGGVSLFPWLFVTFADYPHKRKGVLLCFLAAAALSLFHSWPSLYSRLWYVLLASSGIGWLAFFGLESRRQMTSSRSHLPAFFILWLPAMLAFFILVAEIITARYILILLPPLYLVTFQNIRRKPGLTTFGITALMAFSVAVADYRFVNSYRNYVAQTVVPLQRQGFRFWGAAESGLRYYLRQVGALELDSSDLRPRAGDLIVRQTSFSYSLSIDLAPLLVKIRQVELKDAFPIRTFSAAAGAGFYDSHFGLVPFTFSRVPFDSVEVVEVSPFVKELPQVVPSDFSSVPVWFPGGVLLKQVQPEMKFRALLPQDAKVEYFLEGKGTVDVSHDCITLRKATPGPVLWKNFRIVPNSWPANSQERLKSERPRVVD